MSTTHPLYNLWSTITRDITVCIKIQVSNDYYILSNLNSICLFAFIGKHSFDLNCQMFILHIYAQRYFRKILRCFIILCTLDTIKVNNVPSRMTKEWINVSQNGQTLNFIALAAITHISPYFKDGHIVIDLLHFTTYLDVYIFKCVKYVRRYLFSCNNLYIYICALNNGNCF